MTFLMPLGAAALPETTTEGEGTPQVTVADYWQVRVSGGTLKRGRTTVRIARPVTLDVSPATLVTMKDEKYDNLPLFNADTAPWAKGAKLQQLATFETTAPDMLVPGSLVLKTGPGDAAKYVPGKDYALEERWATMGRLPGGIPEGKPVWADYMCGWGRIDSIVVTPQGKALLRQGISHNATPHPPPLEKGQIRLANLWIPGRLPRLTADNLYPILEPNYPELRHGKTPPAARLLPKTWEKLHNGQPLHILAWGDSVTDGGQASDDAHRYQSRFVALLQKQFPKAALRLTTAAWGGRNSDSFLKEPPGTKYNFDQAVIAPHPHLIVMEFVNDAWMTPEVVEEKYSSLLKRFQEIGAEWIILTPHFVRPDWMAAPSVRVESDPRPYVAGLRQFASKHSVALADASLRWGHLLKEGIPYITLLSNSINHPDDRGHELFARSLMELFVGD